MSTDISSGQTIAPRFFSIAAAGHYTSLSPNSIRSLLSSGKLTALRPVRGRVLIDKAQLDDVVSSSTQKLKSGRGIRKR